MLALRVESGKQIPPALAVGSASISAFGGRAGPMHRISRLITCLFLFIWLGFATFAQTSEKHLFSLEDFAALREVADPQLSPDGEWIAYTVRTSDSLQDKLISHIWITNWEG